MTAFHHFSQAEIVPNAETFDALSEYYEMKAHPERYKRYPSFKAAMKDVFSTGSTRVRKLGRFSRVPHTAGLAAGLSCGCRGNSAVLVPNRNTCGFGVLISPASTHRAQGPLG